MTNAKFFKNLSAVLIVLSVVACGKDHLPIAFQQVDPALNEDGSLRPMSVEEQALKPTLIDTVVKQGMSRSLAATAFTKYDRFHSHVKNTGYMAVIDFTKNSGNQRFFLINTKSGHVDPLYVAHGKGSDPNDDGLPTRFSNVPNSKQTSLGAYIVAERFVSSVHGNAARLDGLESTNDLARPRAIILHSAAYVAPGRTKMGMSWGCPAVSMGWISAALRHLAGGAFMYAHGPSKASKEEQIDEMTIQNIMLNPGYKWVDESLEAEEI